MGPWHRGINLDSVYRIGGRESHGRVPDSWGTGTEVSSAKGRGKPSISGARAKSFGFRAGRHGGGPISRSGY